MHVPTEQVPTLAVLTPSSKKTVATILEDSTTAQSSAKTVSCEVHQRGTNGCQLHWVAREVKAGHNPLGAY